MASGMAQRVLIVEDEQHLAEGLRFNLDAEGFDAEVLDNGDRALARLLDPAEHFDLVVLDVMLPGKDGFAVVRELRQRKHFVPVLMLTARGRPEDVTIWPSPPSSRSCSRESGGCCAAAPGPTARPTRPRPKSSTIASRSAAGPSISTPSS